MESDLAVELRVETYGEGEFAPGLAERITAALSQLWAVAWDVKVPVRPSLEHPAEWHAVVPLPGGSTPESVHAKVAAAVLALDTPGALHLRTRWSFQQSPNHQEVYEVRWGTGDD
jgi:hypothetical protein